MVRCLAVSFRRPGPAAFGFASHLLAGLLPFASAGAIARLGLMPGTAALYLAGATVIAAFLAVPRLRAAFSRETHALWLPAARAAFIGGLAGFLLAGVAYYVGLNRAAGAGHTSGVAEYIFITRLDWAVQAAFAVLWLREPWKPTGLMGAVLALAGGVVLGWTGAFGVTGLVAAATYILASLAGYSCFKQLAADRGALGAGALTAWRHLVNTAGFVALAVASGGTTSDGAVISGLALAALAGVLLVVLFMLRFTALTDVPLWVLSAQAPTQALVAIAVVLATTGTMAATTAIGIGCVVAGEILVMRNRPAAST